jgi:hypothetical protein
MGLDSEMWELSHRTGHPIYRSLIAISGLSSGRRPDPLIVECIGDMHSLRIIHDDNGVYRY